MKKYFYVCCLLLIASCEQVNKSFRETENPVPVSDGKNNASGSFTESTTSSVETISNTIATHLQAMSSSNGTITDSDVLRMIQAQMKSAGIKDSAAILARIQEQLKKMPQLEDRIENAENNFIKDGEKLDQIQTELKNLPQFKGKKLMLYRSIYMRKSLAKWVIYISMQNPDKPENIDNYQYQDGAWQTPTPDKSPDLGGDVSYLCSLDKVQFSTAKKVYEMAVQKSKEVEGAESVSNINFFYSSFKNKTDAEWYTSIRGARNDYRLKFDISGNLVETKKQ